MPCDHNKSFLEGTYLLIMHFCIHLTALICLFKHFTQKALGSVHWSLLTLHQGPHLLHASGLSNQRMKFSKLHPCLSSSQALQLAQEVRNYLRCASMHTRNAQNSIQHHHKLWHD